MFLSIQSVKIIANLVSTTDSVAHLVRIFELKLQVLSGNRIRDEGVQVLAESLAKSNKLVTLDISSNEISYRGAISLS